MVGGFGLSLIIGVVAVFVLKNSNIGKSSSVPPALEIAVGVLALVVAFLVGTRISATVRDKAQARRPEVTLPNLDSPASPDGPPGIESMPGFDKLPGRVKSALSQESPWVAWVAGLAVGMPTAYYLAAIAAIHKSGSSAGTQVAALVVFNSISSTPGSVATRERSSRCWQAWSASTWSSSESANSDARQITCPQSLDRSRHGH